MSPTLTTTLDPIDQFYAEWYRRYGSADVDISTILDLAEDVPRLTATISANASPFLLGDLWSRVAWPDGITGPDVPWWFPAFPFWLSSRIGIQCGELTILRAAWTDGRFSMQASKATDLLAFPAFKEELQKKLQRDRRDHLVQKHRLASLPERSLEQLVVSLVVGGRIEIAEALRLLSMTDETLMSYLLDQREYAAQREADAQVALA